MRGVRITGRPPDDWLADAKAVTDQLLAAEATTIGEAAFALELVPGLTRLSGLPKKGTSLLAVAKIGDKIHVRVFNAGSKLWVDAPQPKSDYAGSLFRQLSELLESKWNLAASTPTIEKRSSGSPRRSSGAN